MKKNKLNIPPEMRPKKDREDLTSKFAFRKDMMMASMYLNKKRQLLRCLRCIQMQALTKGLETSTNLQL